MASGRLLDANYVIALINGDTQLQEHVKRIDVSIPSVVVGELYFGAYKTSRVETNIARIDHFMDGRVILACDVETAKHYGRIKNQLKEKGRPIPENDIWIAAIAQQYDLIMATRDRHFQDIDDLEVESW